MKKVTKMVLDHIYMQGGAVGAFYQEHEGGSDCQTLPFFLFFYQQFELRWRVVEVKKIKLKCCP